MKTPMTIPRTDSGGKYRQPLTDEQAAGLKKLADVFGMTPMEVFRRRHSLPGQPKFPEIAEVEVVFKDPQLAKVAGALADYNGETLKNFIGRSISSDLEMCTDGIIFHPKTGAVVGDMFDFGPCEEAKARRVLDAARKEVK